MFATMRHGGVLRNKSEPFNSAQDARKAAAVILDFDGRSNLASDTLSDTH
jgi:hypothetical protein